MTMNTQHLKNLVERAPELKVCLGDIEVAFALLLNSIQNQGKLLLCGNGGSAADSEHWAGELLKGFCSKRPLSENDRANLPEEVASKLQKAIPAIPLTGFLSLSTAFSNDVSPELVFSQLVWALGKSNDVFIGLSTSGNAKNVCHAAQVAKKCGLKTIALTGKDGGMLAPLCDIAICVPATETYRIQEYHLPIYHCLSLMLEETLFGS